MGDRWNNYGEEEEFHRQEDLVEEETWQTRLRDDAMNPFGHDSNLHMLGLGPQAQGQHIEFSNFVMFVLASILLALMGLRKIHSYQQLIWKRQGALMHA